MSGEDHLAFLGKVIQDLTGNLLKLRVEEDLRILHENQRGHPVGVLHVSLQQGQQIDAAHTFAQPGDGGRKGLGRLPDQALHLKNIPRMAGQIIGNAAVGAAVSGKIVVHPGGKIL